MSSNSKSSEYNSQTNKTLSQFDRGPLQILNYLSTLTKSEVTHIQLLCFALLEILSLNLTNNDPIKSHLLFQLLLDFLAKSKILPASMSLSTKPIRHLKLFQDYVRNLQESIHTALSLIQRYSTSSDRSTITNLLGKDFEKTLISPPPPTLPSPNISIDIPQQDIQLKMLLPLAMKETTATNSFDNNVVIFRYVRDFYEIDKLGKGAFGSVFRARNRLDDRSYAVKKIVFNENTNRTRRQAQRALREVRVLASLSHPNIVQYHCAWLELVPIGTRTCRTSSSSSSPPPRIKKPVSQVKQFDSLDELIEFEGQSSSSPANEKQKEEVRSPQKSSTTSTDYDEDENEISAFGINGNHSDIQIQHEYHSDGGNHSLSSSKVSVEHIKSHYETSSNEKLSNKELVPLHTRNQYIHPIAQSNYMNSKIVLFIQMQLCDSTLHDWLRARDHAIIEETPNKMKNMFYSLNDLGQRQCWHIFKQLLTAVQYLHSQSFVHRDIKPRNIFLAYDSKDSSSVHVKLGDFGLATLLDSESTSDSSEQLKSAESTGVGTALYAPPEQLNSNHCIATAKSDSYSLGIVLFELFNIFPTEMGRYYCLSDLRIHTKVEDQFSKYYPFETYIIEQLVSLESDKRPSIEQILTMYANEIQQRIKKKQYNTKQMIIEQFQEKLRDKDRRIQQLELELKKNKS
ncbi:unnamed protein product [Rotaria sp. Silwood2]|nr:unnamed protein product [Rotaria sp. Silwood2]CAF2640159.1 unnamed protein product [Rotaria sp. Silwood2]CAF2913891.1 unnamed protein product [Rotaria sp. Silwood2]CAF3015758.1 unnamed protein product [Rotaria sp. Silwood2]CAF4021097.1 unnamed protein product [Rotaria sp. Silwood2]